MQNKSYPSKWLITYQGKAYASIYGKKKAYDLCVRLSHCVNGLVVEAAPKRKSTKTHMDKREYHREWRANNKEKVREYNKRSYQKRKHKQMLDQIREEGFNVMEQAGSLQQEVYQEYLHWLKSGIPNWMREELANLSEAEVADRFGRHLEFGTGGLRAEIGIGTNRMNVYTVRRVTQGLADYLNKSKVDEEPCRVVIAYDTRHLSHEFADEAALVLAQNGIAAYVFEEVCPTPILSYAVRQLQASAGIVITASHNPPSYNGYKVYGADGAQITTKVADDITEAIDQVENMLDIPVMAKDEARVMARYISIGSEILEQYYDQVRTIIQNPAVIEAQGEQLKIVYTPLHGTGAIPVREVLLRAGFRHVVLVPEQARPDSKFSTVTSPNPEDAEALRLAIELASNTESDIVLGTDPDTDRVGIAVRDANGEYVCLNGNETGALMLNYILSQMESAGRLPENGVMIKTIVTSELGRVIASSYGVETVETLTGFKYIGEKIREMKQAGDKQFLFGYEESYGYLIGDFARDKDAVQACLLIAEMAAFYKQQGQTLLDALHQLHERFGYYVEDQHSISLTGLEGMVRINEIMGYLREHLVPKIEGWRVNWIRDFERGTEFHLSSNMLRATGLPRSNVMHYSFVNASWFAVRPSGTEPKLKIYFGTLGESKHDAEQQMEQLKNGVMELLTNIQNHIGLKVAPR